MNEKMTPDIIISRLPNYLRTLQRLEQEGERTISSQALGNLLGISAAQIRKDLSQFGGFGKQGMGYSIPYLVKNLKDILNITHPWEMVLVGIGSLGHAIAHYERFPEYGFKIAMVFDSNPKIVGTQVGDLIVEDVKFMVERIRKAGIKIAMITVPLDDAQGVTDLLTTAGIKAILNYAPLQLKVPPDVRIQNIDPVIHLQRMTYYLND
jgi:redox-sensing transcriptional repressor